MPNPNMTRAEEVAAAKAQSHWSAKQRNHLRRCIKRGDTILCWNSDAQGRPANNMLDHMHNRDWTARPGLVQSVAGPLELCGPQALHGTYEPHRWAGCRVWVVALVGEVKSDGHDKRGALRREIIGEIMPEEAPNPSVGVRVGRRDLTGANLTRANLDGANLTRANLTRANLDGANLYGANLDGANLTRANLTRANLDGANLTRANLDGANLDGANLDGANLTRANLTRANLTRANLTRANLDGANLDGANLDGANLDGCYLPKSRPAPAGWTHDPPVAERGWVLLRRKAVSP